MEGEGAATDHQHNTRMRGARGFQVGPAGAGRGRGRGRGRGAGRAAHPGVDIAVNDEDAREPGDDDHQPTMQAAIYLKLQPSEQFSQQRPPG